MTNSWYRMWHGTPNDPKLRVVSRASGQPLSLVMAVWYAILDDASQNSKSRGVTQCHDEEIAVTVECDTSQVEAIKKAMQGRLLDGSALTGWDKRQPKREDSGGDESGAKSAAQRKREQRERERQTKEQGGVTEGHEASRNVTLDTDKDKDKEGKPHSSPAKPDDSNGEGEPSDPSQGSAAGRVHPIVPDTPHEALIDLYHATLPELPSVKAWGEKRAKALKKTWRWLLTARRRSGERFATSAQEGIDWFQRYFEHCGKSDFLMGRAGDKWQADLEWLVNYDNVVKVIEGRYHPADEVAK